MSVSQVDQVDWILVPGHHIGQIREVLREQRLQVCCMRVVSRVLDLCRLWLRRSVDYKDTRLIPNAAKERSSWQQWNLSYIFAWEDFVLSKVEFFIFENSEVHSIAAAETKLIRSVCLAYFVDVSSKELRLMDFDQLLHFSDPDYIDITLVFTTANSDIVYFAHRKDVALSHNAIKYVESECIYEV